MASLSLNVTNPNPLGISDQSTMITHSLISPKLPKCRRKDSSVDVAASPPTKIFLKKASNEVIYLLFVKGAGVCDLKRVLKF